MVNAYLALKILVSREARIIRQTLCVKVKFQSKCQKLLTIKDKI